MSTILGTMYILELQSFFVDKRQPECSKHEDKQPLEGECERGEKGELEKYEGERAEEKEAGKTDRGDSVTVPLLLRRRSGIPS